MPSASLNPSAPTDLLPFCTSFTPIAARLPRRLNRTRICVSQGVRVRDAVASLTRLGGCGSRSFGSFGGNSGTNGARLEVWARMMRRVVIIGPGASGKSTLALQLGEITGLPVVELDQVFWRPGLVHTPRDEWVAVQQRLVEKNEWILDGDLGPYDAVEVRLRAADTVLFLDFSLVRCAWRAARRSRERLDFWLWLLRYRRRGRPFLLEAIGDNAGKAECHVLRNPAAVRRFVANAIRNIA